MKGLDTYCLGSTSVQIKNETVLCTTSYFIAMSVGDKLSPRITNGYFLNIVSKTNCSKQEKRPSSYG